MVIKRERGVSPLLSRSCKQPFLREQMSLILLGRRSLLVAKSEDLPFANSNKSASGVRRLKWNEEKISFNTDRVDNGILCRYGTD